MSSFGIVFADLRQAYRSIIRMPALSSVVILSLAAGIGINTVVFSWIQARILKPIPGAPDSAAVLLIEPKSEAGLYTGASWPEFEDMREQLRSFESVFAAAIAPLYVGEPGNVERVFGLLVSDNYFSALRVMPVKGRFFAPEEVQKAGASVVVISHRVWTARFEGSAEVLGRTLRVNGRDLTVIGVTPPEFQGTTVGLQFDAWLPATLATSAAGSRRIDDRSSRGYGVMGRLRRGITPQQAQTELDGVMRQLAADYPATNTNVSGEVLPFHMSPRGPQRMLNLALGVLQGIMLLLLLAVCGNVANLLLARASARQKEMGIRLSLGAKPWRIASLLLTESVLLAILGAALGALIAVWGTRALLVLPMVGIPLRFETSIDGTALGFALGLGALSGVLFGVVPALHLARIDPQRVFRSGVQSGGRSRLRHTLMAVQVALAIMVLIVAGLFVGAFVESRNTDPGFRRDGLMLATYDVSGRSLDAAARRTLARRTIERLATIPSIQSVAIASAVPLDIHGLGTRLFTVDGHARADGQQDEALTNIVTPGYFEVMGIPIVSGSDFASLASDSTVTQVIVNEEFVRRYVPAGEPIGRQVRLRAAVYVISGVVRNSIYNAFGEPPTPILYFSYRDVPIGSGEIHLRLRPGAATTVGADVGRAMRDIDPELPVFNIRSMHQHVDTNLIFRKIPAQMFSVLGPMLLVLAAVGIYAVVSYSVSMRTREIGVRLAVGAPPARVVRTFVGEGLTVALAGGLIGWSIAFLVASGLLPAERIDLTVFAVVPVILIAVATLACWIPARRAARVDPAITLRE
jgi:predicted permease